jgi:hypothetical protein
MNWHEANEWIAALSSSNYLGFSDWRLPQTTQSDPNCSLQNAHTGFPLQGERFNCFLSDMGHLFYGESIEAVAPGPFLNVQNGIYWSATSFAPDTANAWRFNFNNGFQDKVNKGFSSYAWAIRTGDSVLPPAVPMLGPFGIAMVSVLLAMAGWRSLNQCPGNRGRFTSLATEIARH